MKLILALIILTFISSCSFNTEITVLKDENLNLYTCKLGDSFADMTFDSYEEAFSYCTKWKRIWLASVENTKKDWKEVSK